MKYDDDNVLAVPAEEVLKLSGGGIDGSCDQSHDLFSAGDWHMAYILIYGPEQVEIMEHEEPMST